MAGTSRDEGRIPTYTMLLDCLATKTRIVTCSDRVEHVRRTPLGGSCTDGWSRGAGNLLKRRPGAPCTLCYSRGPLLLSVVA